MFVTNIITNKSHTEVRRNGALFISSFFLSFNNHKEYLSMTEGDVRIKQWTVEGIWRMWSWLF